MSCKITIFSLPRLSTGFANLPYWHDHISFSWFVCLCSLLVSWQQMFAQFFFQISFCFVSLSRRLEKILICCCCLRWTLAHLRVCFFICIYLSCCCCFCCCCCFFYRCMYVYLLYFLHFFFFFFVLCVFVSNVLFKIYLR